MNLTTLKKILTKNNILQNLTKNFKNVPKNLTNLHKILHLSFCVPAFWLSQQKQKKFWILGITCGMPNSHNCSQWPKYKVHRNAEIETESSVRGCPTLRMHHCVYMTPPWVLNLFNLSFLIRVLAEKHTLKFMQPHSPGSPHARTKNGKEREKPGKIYHVRNVIAIENLITCGWMNEFAHALIYSFSRESFMTERD